MTKAGAGSRRRGLCPPIPEMRRMAQRSYALLDTLPLAHAAPGFGVASAGGGQAGRMRVKVEPWPNRLSARRRPW